MNFIFFLLLRSLPFDAIDRLIFFRFLFQFLFFFYFFSYAAELIFFLLFYTRFVVILDALGGVVVVVDFFLHLHFILSM